MTRDTKAMKPLSPEERAGIQSLVDHPSDVITLEFHREALRRALAAEQFWREAVRNAQPVRTDAEYYDGQSEHVCNFCGNTGLAFNEKTNLFDCGNQECAFVLAQSEDV